MRNLKSKFAKQLGGGNFDDTFKLIIMFYLLYREQREWLAGGLENLF